MVEAKITFYDELNDLLPSRDRQRQLYIGFNERQSIKHIVESLGIPHTEIGSLVVNGHNVDFGYLVQSGDDILVYPAIPDLDKLSGMFKDGQLIIEPRFILDNHLGKLASYLRMCGIDAIYRNDYHDEELVQVAVQDQRILLTRDRQLLMRKIIPYGYLLRSLDPERQVIEIIRRFDLFKLISPFHRCLRCNTPLEKIEKEKIIDRLQPLTKKYFQEFHHCRGCGQIYWRGSHHKRMENLLFRILGSATTEGI